MSGFPMSSMSSCSTRVDNANNSPGTVVSSSISDDITSIRRCVGFRSRPDRVRMWLVVCCCGSCRSLWPCAPSESCGGVRSMVGPCCAYCGGVPPDGLVFGLWMGASSGHVLFDICCCQSSGGVPVGVCCGAPSCPFCLLRRFPFWLLCGCPVRLASAKNVLTCHVAVSCSCWRVWKLRSNRTWNCGLTCPVCRLSTNATFLLWIGDWPK